MSKYMKLSYELSQSPVPVSSDPATIYSLIKMMPDGGILKNRKMPLDLIMVLDNSGSMSSQASKHSSLSRLSLLKDACCEAVDHLEKGDRLTIYIFSYDSKMIYRPTIIKNRKDRDAARKAINGINVEGCTHLSTSLDQLLKIKSPGNFIRRALVFTDGEVNSPNLQKEEKDCLNLAGKARKKSVPFWMFGTGITYNEQFLRSMAERSGGRFEHISDPADMTAIFTGLVRNFKDVAVTNVEMTIQSVPGVVFRKISRVIPDIYNHNSFRDDYFNTQAPDIDRVRGVSYLLQMEVEPGFKGVEKLASVDVVYDVPLFGRLGLSDSSSMEVEFTNDPALAKRNQDVIDVVTLQGAHDMATLAAEKAQTGQSGLATKLMTKAATIYKKMGADDMATNLMTLSNAVQSQGGVQGRNINIQRTLTTNAGKMVTRRLTNRMPGS